MIAKVLLPLLVCSLYCSAIPPPFRITIDGDVNNWKSVNNSLLPLNASTARSGGVENTFDQILRANAAARSTTNGRSDTKDKKAFLFEGDIDLSIIEVNKLFNNNNNNGRGKRAVMKKTATNLWEKNQVNYALDSSLSGGTKTKIMAAIREWQATLSCMGTWRDVTRATRSTRNYMHFFRGSGCYSQVGRVGGGQRVSIGNGCEHHGIIVHEIGHAMGLWHEQSRPDRGDFVRINWGNILRGMEFNFQKHTTSTVNSLDVAYDYGSVMHYGATAFTKNRRATIVNIKNRQRLGQRTGLSPFDKIQVNKLYCPTTTKPTGCSDHANLKDFCKASKTLKLCTNPNFKTYMTRYCCKTCQVSPCIDSGKYCPYWKGKGFCRYGSKHYTFMKNNCARTCNLCT